MADAGWLAARYTIDRNSSGGLLCRNIEIKIKGPLVPRWSDWFASLKLTHLEGDETLISGLPPDPAAVHGLLEPIRDLNLTWVSVYCGTPSTQDMDQNNKEES